MSCHCNNCVQPCNPCKIISPEQNFPSCQSYIPCTQPCIPQPCVPQPCVPQPCVPQPCIPQPCVPQPCIPCVQPCYPQPSPPDPCQPLPCGSKHCSECRKDKCRKHNRRHCSKCSDNSEYDRKDSERYHGDKREHRNKDPKRCNKCYRHDCDCIEYYPCLRTKCGFTSAMLTKTASSARYTEAGQVITYHYTITNTGTDMICYPIQICDDKLGGYIIPHSNIPPCMSQTFSRTYTIVTPDLEQPFITNTAIAYIKVKHNKWVVTQPASATITRG